MECCKSFDHFCNLVTDRPVTRIPSSNITDCYPRPTSGLVQGGSYLSTEIQSTYSTADKEDDCLKKTTPGVKNLLTRSLIINATLTEYKSLLNGVTMLTIYSWTGYNTRSFLKRGTEDLNSEFSFSLTGCRNKAKEPSLPHHLPVAGGVRRRDGFMSIPRALTQSETQKVLFSTWTIATDSIFHDDNR